MKKNKLIYILFLGLFLLPYIFIPQTTGVKIDYKNLSTAQVPKSSIRIAIYDESNLTRPSYSSIGSMNNNHSVITSIFTSAGFEFTLLTVADIIDHQLNTANFDVFVINDNLPKDNITNYVKEFWLGGGSLMTFDSAISYLCYFGILPPESTGDEGYGTYWSYTYSNTQTIAMRHPISKAYQINDNFNVTYYDWATFDWAALQGTSIASQLSKIANIDGNANLATVVGFDPEDQGGKVLHILGTGGFTGDQIIIDGIDWLCPRPKGKILFDLSHRPYYGMDLWDSLASQPGFYEELRDQLVSREYTVDKLYPSISGNLTLNNLSPYDVIIICVPELNFTAAEVATITNWVGDGGGILTIADNTGFTSELQNINYLYSNFDLKMNLTDGGTNTVTYTFEHPTIEGCSQITALAPGKIVYSGDAYPIWGNDADDIIVAGQDYATGRVLLMSDLATIRDGQLISNDNLQYGINMFNWLSAGNAKILLYTDDLLSTNYYVTPVAQALNQLGLDFYLTFSTYYFNLSLNLYDWGLVIYDNPWSSVSATFDELVEYLDEDGKLIMSSYHVDNDPSHPLWAKMGFEFASDMPNSVPLYIWDQFHSIFSNPIDFDLTQFTSSEDYGDEGDLLTVYANATAIAGYTSLETDDNAVIVLRNDKKTIYNGYLIDQFASDTDDSTYPDNLELWINEINYIWTSKAPQTTTGIPGYDLFAVTLSIFISIGLIGLITIRKHKKLAI